MIRMRDLTLVPRANFQHMFWFGANFHSQGVAEDIG